ncbi:MAG: hypothetical protein IIX79_06370 [Alistipes sp.]|nr:hypothetical protein [Alistipes sp.]
MIREGRVVSRHATVERKRVLIGISTLKFVFETFPQPYDFGGMTHP